MTWFRRGHEPPPVQPEPEEQQDSPDALRLRLWELVQFINRSAGKLPVEAMITFYPLAEINRAAQESSQGKTIKPVLRMPN